MIPGGNYTPFLKSEQGVEEEDVWIDAFYMDKHPVTNHEFESFLEENPSWSKSGVKSSFADKEYLSHWKGDEIGDDLAQKIGDLPVNYVSWFAANTFCKKRGMRLPTLQEWEYASRGDDPKHIKQVMEWYQGETSKEVKNDVLKTKNSFGLFAMHGHHWEWVSDFNSIVVASDSRSGLEDDQSGAGFCGAGSLLSRSNDNYATFMRFAFRSALEARYTSKNLAFRCAKSKAQ